MSTSKLLLLVLLATGCTKKRDDLCGRAVDIALECDKGVSGGMKGDELENFRRYMHEACEAAFESHRDDDQVTRDYATCKAKAESCDDYWKCESVLKLPPKK